MTVARGTLALSWIVLSFFSPSTPAELIVNGGFEAPALPAGAEYITAASPTNHAGWVVASGSADWQHTNFVSSVDGSQSLDLNGTERGQIYQDIVTIPGQAYRLTFFFAGNPCSFCGNLVKQLEIQWGSTVVDTLEHDATGRSAQQPGWRRFSYRLTGTGTDRLTFRSLTDGLAGPILDGISLVPEDSPVASADVEIQKAVLLSFPTAVGRTYQVEWTTDPEAVSWNLLRSYTGTGETLIVTEPRDHPMRIYRVLELD